MDDRKNNFDFLRLLFASFVIITHSYPLSGVIECDLLCQLTKGQVSFSYIGVKGFFIISGYLIFQSLQRSDDIIDYFWKRFLRLFPALFVVLLLTVILVPFVYQSEVPLFKNRSLLTYIPNTMTLYRIQFGIQGVFENNPYKYIVNGCLWTIPYEFTMYILLSFLIIFRKKKTAVIVILLLSYLLLLTGNLFYLKEAGKYVFILNCAGLFDLGIFFIAGSLLSAVNFKNIRRKKELLILVFTLVLASIYFDFYNYSKYLTLPVLFILFGLIPIPFIYNIGNKIGDLSYGIYIYGFPVQQTLMYYFKLNHIELMIYSMIISCIFAYFSWHFIEKKALKLKKIHPLPVLQNLVNYLTSIRHPDR